MAIKTQGLFASQAGITSSTDAADRTLKLDPKKGLSAMLVLESGSPATGAKIQFTNSSHAAIDAGTALWADSSNGNTLVNRAESNTNSVCCLTGIRAAVTDGTWTLQVRQG